MERVVRRLLDTYIPKFFEPIDERSTKAAPTADDRVRNYASLMMGYGLMAENMHDACKEGDGDRLERC